MDVVTHLPKEAHRTITSLLQRRHKLVALRDVPDLRRALAGTDYDLLLFDPAAVRESVFQQVLAAIACQSQPTVWYTDLADHRLVDAAESGFGEVVFRGCENNRMAFEDRLVMARDGSALGLLFEVLVGRLKTLRFALRASVVRMLGGSIIPGTVSEIAVLLQMPRRSVDRAFHEAGFSTTSDLLDCLRLAGSWMAMGGRESFHTQLEHVGYTTNRTALDHYKRILDLTPRAAVRTLATREVVDRLCSFLTRPDQ